MKVNDLYEDFSDGIKLITLLELLTKDKLVCVCVCVCVRACVVSCVHVSACVCRSTYVYMHMYIRKRL